MKIYLDNVTICAIDSVNPALAARAIEKSSEDIAFANKFLFTDSDVNGDFETIVISKISSKDEYSRFLIKDLNQFIQTEFVLIVQWDGYIVYPHCWTNGFLNYDYIGAKWPWYEEGFNMGNGGFSLRSKKLLNAINKDNFIFIPNINEDELICRINREQLQNIENIRFSSIENAEKFSYERALPETFTFGFHGLFNLWRHESDEEVLKIIGNLNENYYNSLEFVELMCHYWSSRKLNIFMKLFKLFSSALPTNNIDATLQKYIPNKDQRGKLLLTAQKLSRY
jgi:hypothetical protein